MRIECKLGETHMQMDEKKLFYNMNSKEAKT